MTPDAATPDTDGGTAVIAHGLLTSMAVIHAGIVTVWEHWADLPPEKRDHIFERILAHTTFVSETLRDVTQGLPTGALEELEAMQRLRPDAPGVMRPLGNAD